MEEKPEIFKSDRHTKVNAIWRVNFGEGVVYGIDYYEQNYRRRVFIRKEGSERYLSSEDIFVMWLRNRFRIKKRDRIEILVEGADEDAERVTLRVYSGLTTRGNFPDLEVFEGNSRYSSRR
jgi:hypothetical protein